MHLHEGSSYASSLAGTHIHRAISAEKWFTALPLGYPEVMGYEPPPMRDRLPTLPHDLREYAWIHTGPGSETPPPVVARSQAVPALREEELDAIETGLLVDLWHSDVPRVVAGDNASRCVVDDHREAFVLSLLDGESTVGAILEIADLPVAEVLTILCELCARGIVALDRTKRLDSLTPEPSESRPAPAPRIREPLASVA